MRDVIYGLPLTSYKYLYNIYMARFIFILLLQVQHDNHRTNGTEVEPGLRVVLHQLVQDHHERVPALPPPCFPQRPDHLPVQGLHQDFFQ
jgi:hypothetical protein